MKIAVSGKGGVGKTLIAGSLARAFADRKFKTIAIDADSSPNLALTLGVSPEDSHKILPISENKELIESKTGTGYGGVYRLSFSIDDVVRDYSVQTPFDVSLIVMGTVKSADSGCACAANAVVRALLRHLVVERNEVVILDMEAGVEHLGRGTATNVDVMLIVADANMKSLEVARHIHDLASNVGLKQIFLLGNRIGNDAQRNAVVSFAGKYHLRVLDFIPFDPKVVEAEMHGETPLMYEESEAMKAVDRLCEKLETKSNR